MVERVAGEAWHFRTLVEREASTRFARLATELATAGFSDSLVALAARASADERRHAELCRTLARDLGTDVPGGGWDAPRLAPTSFDQTAALLYEVTAQCCVAETESMATLSTLMESMTPSRFRDAVVEIAKDEIDHARLGWAVLEAVHTRRELSLAVLEPHLGAMLETGGAPLFASASAAHESDGLVAYGVLPHSEKRRVFEEALDEVIVPGFARLGIATDAITSWRRAR